ncbi:Molybdopterin biosynthesis protein CNX1 [Cucurbita argyrosperma subsp. argyrosperma]|nr:Molybdopterin biosynthesis protein CNX1 [Cucurbita argyrosperma subsp. argyrosperma]
MADFSSVKSTAMISPDEALRIVLEVAQRLPPVAVSLHDALGKVLAQDIRAPDPLPPYPASIKDGYAVVASDGPGDYPVITESRAGNDGVGVTVTPGTVAYVTTGGPIPDGADAVVQVEDTEKIESKHVKIMVKARKGADIRPVARGVELFLVTLSSSSCKIAPLQSSVDTDCGIPDFHLNFSSKVRNLGNSYGSISTID